MSISTLDFSHAHYPVTSLGYGQRVGLWVQGCSIRCPGCIVPQTWTAAERHRVAIPSLVARLRPWLARSDGVTISGGEPFDQPLALGELVAALRSELSGDILIYSGHPWSHLRQFSDVLSQIDVVVPEPFLQELPSTHPFLGSANQSLKLLTRLARERYRGSEHWTRRLDAAPASDALRMAGVPRRGEFAALRQDVIRSGASEAQRDG